MLGADEAIEGDEGHAEGAQEGGVGMEAEFGVEGFAQAADGDAHELDLFGEADGGRVFEAAALAELVGTGVEAVLEGVLVAFGRAGFAFGGWILRG